MDQILEASHIHKYFGDFHVLNDVSLSVPKGKIFGLLGPNGAGKTTLIRALTQITLPDQGEVLFDGQSMHASLIEKIGYLPEERGLYRKMKVGEQALYLLRLKGLSKSEAMANLVFWFKRLEMTGWWDKKVEDLSKGMQQKLQFVTTVAHRPELLILDEPFSGFDPVNTEIIKQQILYLKEEGTSIIFSTHNMSSVEELCENIALIHKGQNVLSGSVEEVKQSYSKSLFKVRFRGSGVAFANALGHHYEIEEMKEQGQMSLASIKSHTDGGANQLLNALTKHVEVVGFEEQLPSMHDIFIDLVSENEQEEIPANDHGE